MEWQASRLEPLLAVAAATIDESGQLIGANQGFLRLLPASDTPAVGRFVAEFFIQPDFATLARLPASAAGEIYRGLLTCGEYTVPGRTQTLRARLWRAGTQLHLLAEHDIEVLEQLQKSVLDINREYASAQLELVRLNHGLQQREERLRQVVDALTAADAARQQAQDKLLQAEKLASIGFLAAGIAHEINNPIGFVSSNFHTLARYITSLLRLIEACDTAIPVTLRNETDLDFIRADIGSLLDDSRNGIERVQQIVQALRDFSGIDVIEHWQVEDIAASIANALAVLKDELRHCTVRVALGTLPPVECLRAQLDQVFINLLRNAAQAVAEGGSIEVRGACEGDEICIEIADDGCGIAPEHLPHIFDPFFTTRAVGRGTGLGLAVSYGIVARHHGRIEVTSRVGQGATFRVRLPLRRPATG